MTPLPDYDPSKFALLKPGRYMFRITDPPTKKRFGKAVGIILQFLSFSEEDGTMKKSSCLIWPWTDEYRILKEEIIKSSEEDAWVGRNFMGEIEIGKHPTKLGQKIQNIINIEPFYPEETKEEPASELEQEVEDTTITPPKEEEIKDTTPQPPEPEEGDPGPGQEDAPPEEEETDSTPKSPEEDEQEPKKKDSSGDEEAANKKDFPKKDDEKGGPPW